MPVETLTIMSVFPSSQAYTAEPSMTPQQSVQHGNYLCPSNFWTSAPLSTSHRRTLLSEQPKAPLQEATNLLLGEKATPLTGALSI